jgi:hypothetical protein
MGSLGTLANIASHTNNILSYNTSTNTLGYTTGTSISLFAGTTARDATITSPFLGQFCFLTDEAQLQFYKSGIWNNYPPGGSGPTLSTLVVTGPSTYIKQTYVDAANNIVPTPTATGFTIYEFSAPSGGVFSSTSFTIKANKLINISYLLVASGGGGGAGDANSCGGGGGGGGVIMGTNTLQNSTTYDVTIGGSRVWDGFNSSFYAGSGLITAIGGGIGASPVSSAGNGGSGGGCKFGNTPGTGIDGQGKSGSAGQNTTPFSAGGGGGYNSTGSSNGTGGSGLTNNIFFGNNMIRGFSGGGGGGAGNYGGGGSSGGISGVSGSSGYQRNGGYGMFGGGGGGGGINGTGGPGGSGLLGIKFPSYS